jgi:DNA-directed RNA polymerase specialized sigma24 family protein
MSEPLRVVRTSGEVDEGAESFAVFFEAEKAGLFSALCLVTRNRFEAEELTQDAFVRVLERWDRVRNLDDPAATSTERR